MLSSASPSDVGKRLESAAKEGDCIPHIGSRSRQSVIRLAWHCHIHGKQVGPLSAEEWSRLVSQRLLTAETMVWKEGMGDWHPLGEISGLPIPNSPPDHRLHPCNECGRLNLDDDLLRLGAVRICNPCKPAHLQRLRESAPPASSNPAAGVFASGKYLVVRSGAAIPPHCVLCNQPGTWRRLQSYSWHPNWLLLTLLGTPVALVIAALIFSRSIQMELVLCDEHRRTRQRRLVLAGVWIVSGLVVLLGGMLALKQGIPLPASMCLVASGLISLLMGPLYAQRVTGVLIARRISPEGAVFRGAHPSYLGALPPWTGDPP